MITPIGGAQAASALSEPAVLLAGIGVGVCSSVIPYVTDQLAMARLPRSTYAVMVSLLPAIATVIGVAVPGRIPSPSELVGVGLVIAGRRRPPTGGWRAGRVILAAVECGFRAVSRRFGPAAADPSAFGTRSS